MKKHYNNIMKNLGISVLGISIIVLIATSWVVSKQNNKDKGVRKVSLIAPKGKAIAAFAEGCFWTSTHLFEAIQGVDSAIAGYAGGKKVMPTYEEVCSGSTGHAETILVYYDPKQVSYAELTKAFFASHDASTLNRQGPDVGDDYRSVIYFSNPLERSLAESAKVMTNKAKVFSSPIVTEILPLTVFYRAEEYHQHYAIHHPENPYIQNVSNARFEKFIASYKGKIKSSVK